MNFPQQVVSEPQFQSLDIWRVYDSVGSGTIFVAEMELSAVLNNDKFSGRNDFRMWQQKVKNILKQTNCYNIVFDVAKIPKEIKEGDRDKMEMKAFSVI